MRIEALLGPQSELFTRQRSNRIPSFARRSMFGVRMRFRESPYTLTACQAWSSDKMNKMFGLVWFVSGVLRSVVNCANKMETSRKCFMGLSLNIVIRLRFLAPKKFALSQLLRTIQITWCLPTPQREVNVFSERTRSPARLL